MLGKNGSYTDTRRKVVARQKWSPKHNLGRELNEKRLTWNIGILELILLYQEKVKEAPAIHEDIFFPIENQINTCLPRILNEPSVSRPTLLRQDNFAS